MNDPLAQRRVLVINPNTTESVTELVLRHCRQLCPDVIWDGATSRLGAGYISTEATYAIAGHAVLETYADRVDGHDAVMIACFGDPGLLALREIATVPIVGLAHASFVAAARKGRFAVVTGGKAWEPMLQRFARLHQLDAQLAGVFTVELTGAQIAAAPGDALDALRQAAMLGVRAGARSIVLGGAALGGLATELQAGVPLPVFDNVSLAALATVEAMAAEVGGKGVNAGVPATSRIHGPVVGTGLALAALLHAR